MTFENDFKTLKSLNHELKKYKVKLSFQYYDVSPFNKKVNRKNRIKWRWNYRYTLQGAKSL